MKRDLERFIANAPNVRDMLSYLMELSSRRVSGAMILKLRDGVLQSSGTVNQTGVAWRCECRDVAGEGNLPQPALDRSGEKVYG